MEATQGLLLLHNNPLELLRCHNSTLGLLRCHTSTLGLLRCHISTLGLLRCHNSYLGCHDRLQNAYKNIESGLIRARKPSFGLKLRAVTAGLPRMPVECLMGPWGPRCQGAMGAPWAP